MINRYVNDEYNVSNQPTVGIDFLSKTIQSENRAIRL